jgi:hypothetical protein
MMNGFFERILWRRDKSQTLGMAFCGIFSSSPAPNLDEHAQADGANVEVGEAEGIAVAIDETDFFGILLGGSGGIESTLQRLFHGEHDSILDAAIGLCWFSKHSGPTGRVCRPLQLIDNAVQGGPGRTIGRRRRFQTGWLMRHGCRRQVGLTSGLFARNFPGLTGAASLRDARFRRAAARLAILSGRSGHLPFDLRLAVGRLNRPLA